MSPIRLAVGFLCCGFFWSPLARCADAATITIVNQDFAGEGFNDPAPRSPVGGNTGTTLGQQRMIAFQYAADLWGARIGSQAEIRVDAQFTDLDCDGNGAVLGQAGSTAVFRNTTNVPRSNTFYVPSLADAIAGFDLVGDESDIFAQFNSAIDNDCFGVQFYYGLDGNAGSSIDFVTVLAHELAHGLGFLSFVDSTCIGNGEKLNGFDDAYMVHLEDHSTGETWPSMNSFERANSALDPGDLHWIGQNVRAEAALTNGVHGSGHVQMFAPNPMRCGSSISHFDETLFPNELMEPNFQTINHNLDLTAALFKDLGYPVIYDCGDANQDGNVNAVDALAMLRVAVGLDDCIESLCDVNGDGITTASDTLATLQFGVGAPIHLSCGFF